MVFGEFLFLGKLLTKTIGILIGTTTKNYKNFKWQSKKSYNPVHICAESLPIKNKVFSVITEYHKTMWIKSDKIECQKC